MGNVNVACLLVQGCLYKRPQSWTVFTVWCRMVAHKQSHGDSVQMAAGTEFMTVTV